MRRIVLCLLIGVAHASDRYPLEGQWRLKTDSASANWFDPKLDDSNWDLVTAPRADDAGWYRLTFSAPPLADRSARLILNPALDSAAVWLNGRELWNHDYGGDALETDIAELLRQDQPNVLALYLERRQGTLNPNAYLLIAPRVFISNQRVVAVPDAKDGGAAVTASVWITNASENTAIVEIESKAAPDGGGSTTGLTVSPGTTVAAELRWRIPSRMARPWDQQHPNLYKLSTSLTAVSDSGDTHFRDSDEVVFGIRRIDARANSGAKPTRIVAGEVTPEWLASADTNGLTLIEACAGDRSILRKMIQRDWNHPSIVGWSIHNRADADFVKALDGSRPVRIE